jgi:hypothetical protein
MLEPGADFIGPGLELLVRDVEGQGTEVVRQFADLDVLVMHPGGELLCVHRSALQT